MIVVIINHQKLILLKLKPDHMYRSGPACVNRCPEGTTADDETSTCEECKGPCPKSLIIDFF